MACSGVTTSPSPMGWCEVIASTSVKSSTDSPSSVGRAATLVQSYVEVFLSSDDQLDSHDRSAGYAFIDPVPAETSVELPVDVSLARMKPGAESTAREPTGTP